MRTLVLALFLSVSVFGEAKVIVDHNASVAPAFRFQKTPRPSRGDTASQGKFRIVDGGADANGAGVEALNDGRLPTEEDQPSRNFFFSAGSEGGRLLLDLGKTISIKEINSFSWHSGGRAPQIYVVYASDEAVTAEKALKRPADPLGAGWKKLAAVEARTESGDVGGQYGVNISDENGALGRFRYLLFDIVATAKNDRFAQTFFSEIDVIDRDAPAAAEADSPSEPVESKKMIAFEGADGRNYQFTFDTTMAADLAEWTDQNLIPVAKEWYPKLVAMLPSEGYSAPTNVTIRFRDNMGRTPASAGGAGVNCNADWFRRNLKGEAIGAVVHELVHVVQNYGWGRRNNANATRTPGWIVEGIPDYIRWFLYEPQTRGAEITERNLSRAKYDASYRITGNFIDWAVRKYDKDLVKKLNAAARAGNYNEELWKEYTSKTVQELGEEWRKEHEERLAKIELK